MPRNYLIIGLKDIHVERVENPGREKIYIIGRYQGKAECRHCLSPKVQSRGWRKRSLKHTRQGNQIVEIKLRVRKLKCHACHRQGMQKVPHIMPWRRATENFRMEVYEQHLGGISQSGFSKTHGISGSTVERWFWNFLEKKYSELKSRQCPIVMGIDEHFFSRKKGYATTIADLKTHRVFDVVLGRSESSLEGYLKRLKGRDRVKVVLMDLSSTYRTIVQKYFPNAKIVADRFHVVRLIMQHFQKLWAQIDPQGKNNRGLLKLFRTKRENLSQDQVKNLLKYFEKFPALKVIDQVQQRILEIVRVKNINKKAARELIPRFLTLVDELKNAGFPSLSTLGSTLESWAEEIVRMWRFTKTNSITEGLHTKMEMISRRAFGFRNFKNYRLRVIVLCGADGLFNRRDV